MLSITLMDRVWLPAVQTRKLKFLIVVLKDCFSIMTLTKKMLTLLLSIPMVNTWSHLQTTPQLRFGI